MSGVSMCLGWPPSVNHAWRPTAKHGKILSDEYRSFIKHVGDCVLEQRIPRHWTTAKLLIAINCRPPNARSFDIDNRVKTTLDAIVRAGVIEDDKHVDLLIVHRGHINAPHGSIDVLIEELEAADKACLFAAGWLQVITQADEPPLLVPARERQRERLASRAKRYTQRRMFAQYLK